MVNAWKHIFDGVPDRMHGISEFRCAYDEHFAKTTVHELPDITGQQLKDAAIQGAKTAPGLDQWAPAELAYLSPLAFQWLAILCNAVECGVPWPVQLTVGRAAILAKKGRNINDPMAFRLLLLLPSVYRLWSKVRLQQLSAWMQEWDLPELYAGTMGRSAEDAWTAAGLDTEYALMSKTRLDITTLDLYKFFDAVPREALLVLLAMSGLPARVLKAYFSYHQKLEVINCFQGVPGQRVHRQVSIPQGCPWSMAFSTLCVRPLIKLIYLSGCMPRAC